MNKVLIICGPTATGKTKFALELAKKFNGELVSADSRQVYIGNDLETGKDFHLNTDHIKIWLLDILQQGEEFSVSAWRHLAQEAIKDILSQGKLPIVVGGSGLYIKSLVQDLPDIDVPYDKKLRRDWEDKSAKELFDYLKSINLKKANSMNASDSQNPRRLIRAIEITQHPSLTSQDASRRLDLREGMGVSYLQIGLTSSKENLVAKIKKRVVDRGIAKSFEAKEVAIMKKQVVWFKKQPLVTWFDVTKPDWQAQAIKLVSSWYN